MSLAAPAFSPSDSVGLDHVGFIVPDLDATCRLVEALGFELTARAGHTRTLPDARVVPMGSAQRSLMLEQGYIEIMQITDPKAGHPLALAPTVRHGLHVLALGTDDAAHCHAQRVGAGMQVGALGHWSRPVQERERQGLARFAFFGAAWTAQDASFVCWVQHLTAQLLRSPGLLAHANGARALTGLGYAGPPQEASGWTRKLLAAGCTLLHQDSHAAVLDLQGAQIRVESDPACANLLPMEITLALDALDEIAARSERLGLAAERMPDGALRLDLRAQLGMYWRLVAQPSDPSHRAKH